MAKEKKAWKKHTALDQFYDYSSSTGSKFFDIIGMDGVGDSIQGVTDKIHTGLGGDIIRGEEGSASEMLGLYKNEEKPEVVDPNAKMEIEQGVTVGGVKQDPRLDPTQTTGAPISINPSAVNPPVPGQTTPESFKATPQQSPYSNNTGGKQPTFQDDIARQMMAVADPNQNTQNSLFQQL